MSTVTFKTEEAIFQFNREAVTKCIEHKKSLYQIQELDLLLDVISRQTRKATLSVEEHRCIGYIALQLISIGEGSVVCKNCGKRYHSNRLEDFTVGPDEASFKTVKGKFGGSLNLFLKKPNLPGMYGGKGCRCPRGHILIYMQTWIT